MTNSIKLFLCIASLSISAHAETGGKKEPIFGDYQAPMIKPKISAKPRLISSQDREFKTRIAEASKHSVNFAGHYVLSSFGCGASCVMSFVLDKKSGGVTWLPFTVCCWADINENAKPISFREDSRLIVVTGSRNEQGKGVYYYEFNGSQFVLRYEAEQ